MLGQSPLLLILGPAAHAGPIFFVLAPSLPDRNQKKPADFKGRREHGSIQCVVITLSLTIGAHCYSQDIGPFRTKPSVWTPLGCKNAPLLCAPTVWGAAKPAEGPPPSLDAFGRIQRRPIGEGYGPGR